MLHSGCVKLHQKFRDFVGLPMGLLREESPKNRMNTGLFGSRSGEYGHSNMTLDWLVYVLGLVAVVFLVVMFFKYKKHNRYADKFEDTYPDAK